MSRYSKQMPIALALAAMAGLSGPAWAEAIELLPMGDSITYGVGSDTKGFATVENPGDTPDDLLGGYRFYLDRLLNPNPLNLNYDFVGNRSAGTGISGSNFEDNNQHFGVRAAEASNDKTGDFGDGDGTNIPSMLTGIHNIGVNPASINTAFDPTSPANHRPSAVLLHIGINSLPKTSLFGGSSTGTYDERLELSISNAVDQFNTLLDGDSDNSRTGLTDRLTDTSYFANEAHLFVAMITPRTDGNGSSSSSQPRYITARQPNMVADYNSRIKAELESRMVPGGDLEGKVTFVDLFAITIDELDTDALAAEFFGGNMTSLMAAISPFDDSSDGGLDYVDWVNHSSYDEGLHDNGALGTPQYVSDMEGDNINPDLMADGLHPTNLGYAITAQVWANAIESANIPEPSALVLLASGSLLVLGRRRRA